MSSLLNLGTAFCIIVTFGLSSNQDILEICLIDWSFKVCNLIFAFNKSIFSISSISFVSVSQTSSSTKKVFNHHLLCILLFLSNSFLIWTLRLRLSSSFWSWGFFDSTCPSKIFSSFFTNISFWFCSTICWCSQSLSFCNSFLYEFPVRFW